MPIRCWGRGGRTLPGRICQSQLCAGPHQELVSRLPLVGSCAPHMPICLEPWHEGGLWPPALPHGQLFTPCRRLTRGLAPAVCCAVPVKCTLPLQTAFSCCVPGWLLTTSTHIVLVAGGKQPASEYPGL
jgi:hypothetical protein